MPDFGGHGAGGCVKLLDELRRRNVLRAAIAYVVTAWLIVESSSLLLDIFKAPDWVAQTIVIMLVAGFPVAVVFAWMFEITPEGIKPDHKVSRDAGTSAASSSLCCSSTSGFLRALLPTRDSRTYPLAYTSPRGRPRKRTCSRM